MTSIPRTCWLLILPCLVIAGCGKKAPQGESEPVLILTNALAVSPGAVATPAHVDIAGVTHDVEVSLVDLLHVSGLLTRGTQQVAVINGNVVSMGEEIDLDANGRMYKLRVLSITDASIKLIAKPQ